MKNYLIKEFPLEIKAEDITEEGIFMGYASTFGGKPDSYGDVIRQGAFKETLKKGGRNGTGIALLWQHDSSKPIGIWTEIVENSRGLKVTGKLNLDVQLGKEAYSLMKMGAVKGLSIGFTPAIDDKGELLEDAYEWDSKKRIRYLNKVDLWEISTVTFPANTRANVTDVKNAIENAKDERELEDALREVGGLSLSASKYIVGLIKDVKFSRGKFLSEEEIQKTIDEKINEEKSKQILAELKRYTKEEIDSYAKESQALDLLKEINK